MVGMQVFSAAMSPMKIPSPIIFKATVPAANMVPVFKKTEKPQQLDHDTFTPRCQSIEEGFR